MGRVGRTVTRYSGRAAKPTGLGLHPIAPTSVTLQGRWLGRRARAGFVLGYGVVAGRFSALERGRLDRGLVGCDTPVARARQSELDREPVGGLRLGLALELELDAGTDRVSQAGGNAL
jgi:hypothetical protein